MPATQTHSDTQEKRMLNRVGIDLHPYVDTIHLAAVETLRGTPDPQVISAGQRALETVIEHARGSARTRPIVEVARIAEQAFQSILAFPPSDPVRAGHNVAAIVADLSRTIDAIDDDTDPTPIIEHAQSLLNSIPQHDSGNLIEIDLNDRDQLARLLQSSPGPDDDHQAAPVQPDVSQLRERFSDFARHAERLLETVEEPETIDQLIDSLNDLQAMASASQIEHIGRVVACALRVVESHRSAGEPLPLDAVEFVIACRRIIPMILESLDEPARVSHAVDALVDQSSFVLLELRQGTRSLGNLWPEPDEAEYREIAEKYPGTSAPPEREPEQPHFDNPEFAPVQETPRERSAYELSLIADGLIGPGPETEALGDIGPSIRVPVEQIERLMQLAGELAIRSGGYNQRARRVLSVSQDVNSIGDRLRYLVRGWNDGKYTEAHVRQHLSEISADLNLAAADLEHARSDHMAASERQADVRARLEDMVSTLRSMPLKTLTDPLDEIVTDLARTTGRDAILRVEGASTVIDALHAEGLAGALRHLVVNAIEHGIERPDDRRRSGKASQGLVQIKAHRDGSQTVIRVMDDGAGIDESLILERAEASGYPIPRRGMTRDRIIQYVFFPGFTTKASTGQDDLGLGLDFVSDAVSRASGSITVHSEVGRGSVFTLRLPVAPMSIPAAIVALSSERFAIPSAEIEQIEPARMGPIEERVDGYRVEVDGTTHPAADLGALLSLRSHHHVQNAQGDFLLITYDDEKWVLRVDRLLESESIAIQPAGREHLHISGVVGTTTLSSGEPALILDIAQVLDSSGRRSRRLSRQTASLTKVPFALVSDDSISVRRELGAHLEQQGWRVLEARDAFEARELLETTVPDLIVVDLDLPAHGGFQISQTARNLGDIPVIGLTASDDPETRKRAETFAIDACIGKPVDLDHFAETVGSIFHDLHSEYRSN